MPHTCHGPTRREALHGQGDRPLASQFAPFDHAAIARAMGCEGLRVERPDELAPALARALACDRPVVIDVVTSLKETFQKVTSPLATAAPKVAVPVRR